MSIVRTKRIQSTATPTDIILKNYTKQPFIMELVKWCASIIIKIIIVDGVGIKCVRLKWELRKSVKTYWTVMKKRARAIEKSMVLWTCRFPNVRKTSIKEPVHTFHKRPIETALNHGLIYPIATSLNSWSFLISLIFFNEEILFYWFGLFSEHQASHKNVFERVWNNEHTANNVEKWTPHTETQSKSKYKLLHKQMPYNVRVQWHFRFSSFHYTDFVCCHHTRKLSNIYSMNLLLNCLHNAAVSILSPKERERDRAFIPIPC